ncbi:MAG TPA: hypothetical protein VFB88_16270 [Xanthobacteraceae bacterium]|nr:hypothetical protein [Xanthobacteraceae bacterium]
MLLKPAVALLMGNPFAGSANTLDAPSKPMPATSKVAIAIIRISFPPMSFTSGVDQTSTALAKRGLTGQHIPSALIPRKALVFGHLLCYGDNIG